MNPSNKVVLRDADEALAAGLQPCAIATPPLASPGRRRKTHDEALLVAPGGELVQLAITACIATDK